MLNRENQDMKPMRENTDIACLLDEAALHLNDQRANPFRVSAYTKAAAALRALDRPVRDVLEKEGHPGLVAMPSIGESIARAIAEVILTGRWSLLEQLRGASAPEDLFTTIPGIGPKLAEAIHSHLHVDTLETLEVAAHDGRLEAVPGIGPRKAMAIRNALSMRLRHRSARLADSEEPPIALLLEIDRRYRAKARANDLPRIAPRRFNPTGAAWLPIMHHDEGGWSFTVLYSNTATAHRFGRTDDWVIVNFERGHTNEGQRTVVTETGGPLQGERVVRGREGECRQHYAKAA